MVLHLKMNYLKGKRCYWRNKQTWATSRQCRISSHNTLCEINHPSLNLAKTIPNSWNLASCNERETLQIIPLWHVELKLCWNDMQLWHSQGVRGSLCKPRDVIHHSIGPVPVQEWMLHDAAMPGWPFFCKRPSHHVTTWGQSVVAVIWPTMVGEGQ